MTGTKKSGRKLEVTLQSIHGIVSAIDDYATDLAATVSFSGASMMQVSSFTMCGRTGNLVIESNNLEKVAADNATTTDSKDSPRTSRLVANFDDPMEKKSPSSSSTSDFSAVSQRPHLQLELPKLGAGSRSKPNGNQTSHSHHEAISLSSLKGDNVKPDIVQLHIAIRNTWHSVYTEGVAHLEVDGSCVNADGATLELPIAQQDQSFAAMATTLEKSAISFQDDAYIRVQIHVASPDQPSQAPEDILLSGNYDEKKINRLLLQKQENEDAAVARTREEHPTTPRIFCNGGVSLGETVRAIMDVLTRCDRLPNKKGIAKKKKSFVPIIRTNSTMESTIVTRESLMI